jgi:hypothetical protein
VRSMGGARGTGSTGGTDAVGQEAKVAQVVVQVVEVEVKRSKKKSEHIGAGQAMQQHTGERCRRHRCRQEDVTEAEGEVWEAEGAQEAQELQRQQ